MESQYGSMRVPVIGPQRVAEPLDGLGPAVGQVPGPRVR